MASLSIEAQQNRREIPLTVPNAHAPDEASNGRRVKDVPDHAVALHLVEASFRAAGDDTTGILPSVLEQPETFIELWPGCLVHAELAQEQCNDAACEQTSSN